VEVEDTSYRQAPPIGEKKIKERKGEGRGAAG
jgi:hypothetical protein